MVKLFERAEAAPVGLGILLVVLLLAFLIESLVEAFFGTPFDKVPALTPYKWVLMYVAFAVGVFGAHVYQLDLLSLMGVYLNYPIAPTVFGITLSGLAIGRGSNYLHDLVTKWFKTAVPPDTLP